MHVDTLVYAVCTFRSTKLQLPYQPITGPWTERTLSQAARGPPREELTQTSLRVNVEGVMYLNVFCVLIPVVFIYVLFLRYYRLDLYKDTALCAYAREECSGW